MKNLRTLFLALLFLPTFIIAQNVIYLKNASFDDFSPSNTPFVFTKIDSLERYKNSIKNAERREKGAWEDCAFKGHSGVDIQPFSYNVETPPFDGRNYIGMVTRVIVLKLFLKKSNRFKQILAI